MYISFNLGVSPSIISAWIAAHRLVFRRQITRPRLTHLSSSTSSRSLLSKLVNASRKTERKHDYDYRMLDKGTNTHFFPLSLFLKDEIFIRSRNAFRIYFPWKFNQQPKHACKSLPERTLSASSSTLFPIWNHWKESQWAIAFTEIETDLATTPRISNEHRKEKKRKKKRRKKKRKREREKGGSRFRT